MPKGVATSTPYALMTFTRNTITFLAPILAAVPISYYTYHYVLPPFNPTSLRARQFREGRYFPKSFEKSYTLTRLVNPRGHLENSMTDSRSVLLSNNEVKNLRDEQILAKFTAGFFGGWAFLPESVGMWALRRFVGYTVGTHFEGM